MTIELVCPNGCGDLVVDGKRLVCTECGATPGFVVDEPSELFFEKALFKAGSRHDLKPFVLVSTPHPFDEGEFARLWDAAHEQPAGEMQFPAWEGPRGMKGEESLEDWRSPYLTDVAGVVARHEEMNVRCSGCGETPCIPDSRGCCPNRPDKEHDLSWGDYEPEPET